MSKFFRVLLVTTYVALTAYAPIQVLKFWGHALSPLAVLGWIFGWSLYCLLAAQARIELMLCRLQVRKPLQGEQERMCEYLDHVLQLAGILRKFQLLILEEPGFDAFATGRKTIVLSRDILEKMNMEQIEAILAHELGHHLSKDCLTSGVYSAARMPTMYLVMLSKWASKVVYPKLVLFRKYFKIRRRLVLLFGLLCVALLAIAHRLLPTAESVALVLTLLFLNRLFLFLWGIILRFTEYKQDAFAVQLGYAKALKEALVTFSEQAPLDFSRFNTLMRGTHPLLYNRIRRLEELEGIR